MKYVADWAAVGWEQFVEGWARLNFHAPLRRRTYMKLADLLRHGVRLMDALEALQKRARRKGNHAPLYVVLTRIRQRLQGGGRFTSSLDDLAPSRERVLIQAGEEAGRLEDGLRWAAENIHDLQSMRREVITGAIYPTLLLTSVVGLLYFIGSHVVPQIADVSNPYRWNGAAAQLHQLSLFVNSPWSPLALAALILGGVAIAYSLPRSVGSDWIRVYLDRIPPWSLYRMVIGANFLVSLSALLQAGMPLEKALHALRRQGSPWLKTRIDATLTALRSGAANLGVALENAGYEFPDREIVDDLTTFAGLSNLDQVLQRYGREWMEKGTLRVKTHSQLLNRFALVVMSAAIAWVVLGMFGIQQEMASNMMM